MIITEQVRDDYEKWNSFLENEVDFWLKDSEKHTKEHCSRVLLRAERAAKVYQKPCIGSVSFVSDLKDAYEKNLLSWKNLPDNTDGDLRKIDGVYYKSE